VPSKFHIDTNTMCNPRISKDTLFFFFFLFCPVCLRFITENFPKGKEKLESCLFNFVTTLILMEESHFLWKVCYAGKVQN